MADNVLINTGNAETGAVNITAATDDVSGVHFQRIKLDYGGDGVSAPLVEKPATDANLIAINAKLPALSGGATPVTGPLTDTQLRATAVPVSNASLPLPAGAATSAAQAIGNTSLGSIDGKLPALSGGAVPVTGPLTDTQLRASAVTIADASTVAVNTAIGAQADSAATTDTGSFSLLAFIKRTLQNWTTLQAKIPAVGATTSALSIPVTLSTDGSFVVLTGSQTEAAPATDTASSGINGRLQRIAQRLSSLIGLLPTALGVGGGLKVEQGDAVHTIGTSVGALNADSIASTDGLFGRFVTVTVVGSSASLTVTVQGSPDATLWNSVYLDRLDAGGNPTAAVSNPSASGFAFSGIFPYRYIRVRITSYTSGSIIAYLSHCTIGAKNVAGYVQVDTELPTAAALADAAATPTAPAVGSHGKVYNGATWDHARSAGSGGTGQGRALVAPGTSVSTIASAVTATGAQTALNLSAAYANHTMQLAVAGGTVSTLTAVLEGSLDGTVWFTLATLTATTAGSAVSVANIPVLQVRANITVITGAGATVTLKYAGTP